MITTQATVFQFKASFSPCTILQLARYDLDQLSSQLIDVVKRAPNFFLGSPVVIELEKVKTLGILDFAKIKEILLSQNLVPIGVRGGSEEQHIAAASVGLPLIAIGKTAFAETPQKKNPENINPTKLITAPIRSGMQIYAKNADLIVIAPVSPGAELLADGHIHVYGPLRGRALAGVQGNTNARIFCRQLDAELVSIAGYYLTKEEMQTYAEVDAMMQIYLYDEQVKVERF